MRRFASLCSGAARRAQTVQPPPPWPPAAAAQLCRRLAHAEAREEDASGGWASRASKARGGSKSAKWAKGHFRTPREPPTRPDGLPDAALPDVAARAQTAGPPALRVVDIPNRVSVRQLARALDVPTERVEAIMAELDESPASEEECVAMPSPVCVSCGARLKRPSPQTGGARHGRAGGAGGWRRGAASRGGAHGA
jgi:hypothetical protein